MGLSARSEWMTEIVHVDDHSAGQRAASTRTVGLVFRNWDLDLMALNLGLAETSREKHEMKLKLLFDLRVDLLG